MRTLRALAVLFAALAATFAVAVPQILLVQLRVPAKDEADPNVPVLQFLAQELEEQGRVLPVVWGLSDPMFRAAVDDGILKNPKEVPNLQDALQAASTMKVEYLFVITAWQEGPRLKAKAQLYRRGSMIWEDPQKSAAMDQAAKNQKIADDIAKKNKQNPPLNQDDEYKPEPGVRVMMISSISEFSAENASRSLARTYAQLLNSDPLRTLPARPKQNTPEPDQGQRVLTIDAPPVRTIDNKQVMAEADAAVKAGKIDVAVNLMREAIDSEPLDVERREHLVKLLLRSGQLQMAALEARRAAALLSEGVDLRVLAARAWLEIGNPAEAQADLNEALARSPEHAGVQLVQGQLNLLKGDLSAAVTNLSASLAKAPSADAHFSRAIAYALGGDAAASKSDLDEANKLVGADGSAARLKLLWPIAIGSGQSAGSSTKQLLQKIRFNRKDAAAVATAATTLKLLDGLSAMLATTEPAAVNKNSHQRLVLALNLLSQSVNGVLEYAKSGDEETLNEATINLGEGIKSLSSALDIRKSEG